MERCGKCGMVEESSIHDINSPDTEIRRVVHHFELVAPCPRCAIKDAALAAANAAKEEEQKRKEYYQNIVYAVCNVLDKINGSAICCGTKDTPTNEVQEAMCSLQSRLAEHTRWVLLNAVDKNALQEAEAHAKRLEEYMLKGVAFRDELQARVKELECQKKALQQVNGETEYRLCMIREAIKRNVIDAPDLQAGNMNEAYLASLELQRRKEALTEAYTSSPPCRHEEEAKRLREESQSGLAMTSCPVCESDGANTNEYRINKEIHRLREAVEWALGMLDDNCDRRYIQSELRRRAGGVE